MISSRKSAAAECVLRSDKRLALSILGQSGRIDLARIVRERELLSRSDVMRDLTHHELFVPIAQKITSRAWFNGLVTPLAEDIVAVSVPDQGPFGAFVHHAVMEGTLREVVAEIGDTYQEVMHSNFCVDRLAGWTRRVGGLVDLEELQSGIFDGLVQYTPAIRRLGLHSAEDWAQESISRGIVGEQIRPLLQRLVDALLEDHGEWRLFYESEEITQSVGQLIDGINADRYWYGAPEGGLEALAILALHVISRECCRRLCDHYDDTCSAVPVWVLARAGDVLGCTWDQQHHEGLVLKTLEYRGYV
jgi:hypothetical protein